MASSNYNLSPSGSATLNTSVPGMAGLGGFQSFFSELARRKMAAQDEAMREQRIRFLNEQADREKSQNAAHLDPTLVAAGHTGPEPGGKTGFVHMDRIPGVTEGYVKANAGDPGAVTSGNIPEGAVSGDPNQAGFSGSGGGVASNTGEKGERGGGNIGAMLGGKSLDEADPGSVLRAQILARRAALDAEEEAAAAKLSGESVAPVTK
jgi:hypothetical protein